MTAVLMCFVARWFVLPGLALCIIADKDLAEASDGGNKSREQHGEDHGLETENMFGFTVGSDTDQADAKSLAFETVGRFGKHGGNYSAIGSKFEFSYGVTDNISAALGVFASYHDISGVPRFADVNSGGFNGIGGEVRWRLLSRESVPVGVTLQVEPSWQTRDEVTGLKGTKFGSENKLIFDTEFVPGHVLGAVNLLYEVERFREDGTSQWEQQSKIGASAALSFAIAPKLFVGGEGRYLRVYDGLLPNTYLGDGWFAGPTLFARIGSNGWISAAWNIQLAGHEVGRSVSLNLTDFDRHQIKLKAGIEF